MSTKGQSILDAMVLRPLARAEMDAMIDEGFIIDDQASIDAEIVQGELVVSAVYTVVHITPPTMIDTVTISSQDYEDDASFRDAIRAIRVLEGRRGKERT